MENTMINEIAIAVRWAPSSAYWSDRLRELLGEEAMTGIKVLECRYMRTWSHLEEAKQLLSQALTRLDEKDSLSEDIKRFLDGS